MPIRATVYIATSLDGFIARENGDLDWLPGIDTDGSGEDYGYAEFIGGVDTLVMGRGTYEKALTFGGWPYAGKRVVVLSTTLAPADLPAELTGAVEVHPGPVPRLLADLEASGARSLYVDGGKVIQSFLREGALDELIITRIPVLIGSGIPLFGETERDVPLRHLRTRAYDDGLVQSTYAVAARVR